MLDVEPAHQLLSSFFSTGKKSTYARKSVIIAYDDEIERAYVVIEGYVKVVSHSSSGAERIHYLYGPGDFFPVTWFFGKAFLHVEFVAFTDVVAMSMPLKETEKFFESNAYSLLAIIQQQTSAYGRIINLGMGNAKQRVAYRLLTLSQRFGKKINDHCIIEIPITIQDLANMVRLTRESTGKVLAELEDKDCIHVGRRDIIVYPEPLKKYAED